MNKSSPSFSLPPILTCLIGMVVGDLAIVLLYVGILWLCSVAPRTESFQNVYWFVGLPSFFLVPLFGGLVAGYFWRRLELNIGGTALASFVMTFLGLAVASVFAGEGIICLLIVSPLLFVIIFGGASIGRVWFKSDPGKLRLSMIPLLALIAAGEPLTRADQTGVVVDEILIRAPAAKVWPQLTSFPPIPTTPNYWLFRLGLPYPVETTSGEILSEPTGSASLVTTWCFEKK